MIHIEVLEKLWSPGIRVIPRNLNSYDYDNYLMSFHNFLGKRYIELIRLSIDLQRYKDHWAELTPGYLQWKINKNYSEKIWECTGLLKNSLESVRISTTLVKIGFDETNSEHVYNLDKARWMEFGTIKMPPRPLFRIVHSYMSKNISYFYGAYKKKELTNLELKKLLKAERNRK